MDGAALGARIPLGRRATGAVRQVDVLRLDLLEHAVDRSKALLADLPRNGDGRTGQVWLREADEVLGAPVEFDRTALLQARTRVVQQMSRSVVERPPEVAQPPDPTPEDRGESGADRYIDVREGSAAREQPSARSSRWAGLSEAATGYTTAAIAALRDDEVSEALDLAVRGLIAFDALPSQAQDRVAEGRMAVALGDLCCEFFDHERALRFYEIAADTLSPATERVAWTSAARQVAELALTRWRELGTAADGHRGDLLTRAEQVAFRLEAIGEPRHVGAVSGRRLVADVRCEQGAPAAAWRLLERADRALSTYTACAKPDLAAREIAGLRLSRGRCLYLLERPEEALVELDAALSIVGTDLDLVHDMEALRLRSLVREAAGDTRGALADTRRLADRVWARHQRQIGGFMDQVWGRAGAESRRRDLEAREQVLIRTAEQDPLTGLANRRGVERFCAQMPAGAGVCLVMIDIDHFKAVNDRFGHTSGDVVLREVAAVLAGSVRAVDQVARWGGEEFLIALPTGSADLGAEAAARVLLRVAEHDWSHIAGDLSLTLSAGVATGPAGDLHAVLLRADAALYEAKHGGRNQVITR